jgi:hypothetical protein
MASSADVVSKALIDVFESVPEYANYDRPESIRRNEDRFRLAVGRLTKAWGDQLLELAEEPPTPLTSRDIQTLDALVETVTAVIEQLDDLDRARSLRAGEGRHEALRRADAGILRALEETSRLMDSLSRSRSASLWIRANAAPVYRRLRRLGRDVALRNHVLRARRHPWRDDSPSLGRAR